MDRTSHHQQGCQHLVDMEQGWVAIGVYSREHLNLNHRLEADAELAPRPSATSPATAIATKRNFHNNSPSSGEAFVPHGCQRSERTDLTLFSKSFETSVNPTTAANAFVSISPNWNVRNRVD